MMRVLAYKTLAPSGDALTGPEGSGDVDAGASFSCDLDCYRRNFLQP